MPSVTHRVSWRFVVRSSESMRSQPRIGLPRISIGRAVLCATIASDSPGVDANHQPALAARSNCHVAVDEKGQPTKHLLLGQPGLILNQATNTVREFLVVGHAKGWQAERGPSARGRH